MLCRILKPFDYSTDGITSRRLCVGAEEDIIDTYAEGLKTEGFISFVSAPPSADAGALVAMHVGRGKWHLFRGEERAHGPFDSREAAEAFAR